MKGQIFSIDMMISLLILIIIGGLFSTIIYNLIDNQKQQDIVNIYDIYAMEIANYISYNVITNYYENTSIPLTIERNFSQFLFKYIFYLNKTKRKDIYFHGVFIELFNNSKRIYTIGYNCNPNFSKGYYTKYLIKKITPFEHEKYNYVQSDFYKMVVYIC